MIRTKSLRHSFRDHRASLIALLVVIVIPAVLLAKALFGDHDYVPFDMSTFSPASVALSPEEVAQRRRGANYDITEKTLLCAPEYRLAREELVEGRFPHWNPHVRGGAPLLANALNGFAYPVHWLFLLWSPERAFGFAAWIAFALAGLLMFGFLREVGLEVLPALFGAVVFQLSGTLAANGHFFMRMETLVWLPAGFWALERMYYHHGVRRIPSFCAFALSVGLCWLAGFPPYALACSFAFGLYILALSLRALREHGIRTGATLATWCGAAIVVGVGIASIQLVPMLDYFPEAQRKLNQGMSELSSQGFDPVGLLGYLMPSPFGHPAETSIVPYDKNPLVYLYYSRANPADGKLHFPINYNYTEYAVYLGALPLLCVLLTVFRGSSRFRHFALPAFVFFVLFSMGGSVFRTLGWLQVFQSTPPVRFAAVASFLGAALAAIGFDIAKTTLSSRKHMALVTVGAALALGCFWIWWRTSDQLADVSSATTDIATRLSERWKADYAPAADVQFVANWFGPFVGPSLERLSVQARNAGVLLLLATCWLFVLGKFAGSSASRAQRVTLLGVLAVMIAAGDLFVHARTVNPTFPRSDPANTPVHEFLRERRVAERANGGFTVARVSKAARLPDALPPNLLIPEHIRDLNCYAFVDSRSSKPFVRLYGAGQMIREYWVKALPADERLQLGLFDLFGVRYLLSTESLPALGPPATPPLEGPGGRFFVYERKSALPRAFLVPAAEAIGDGEEGDESAIARMIEKDFDPRAGVLLHDVGDRRLEETADPKTLADAKVEFADDHPTELTIRVTNSPGAWLVLADTAMSHWNVTRNGGEAEWLRANLCFRAVWLPEGDQEIRFRYDASPFRTGLWLTAGALALLLILLIWWNGHPQKRDPDVVAATTITA